MRGIKQKLDDYGNKTLMRAFEKCCVQQLGKQGNGVLSQIIDVVVPRFAQGLHNGDHMKVNDLVEEVSETLGLRDDETEECVKSMVVEILAAVFAVKEDRGQMDEQAWSYAQDFIDVDIPRFGEADIG